MSCEEQTEERSDVAETTWDLKDEYALVLAFDKQKEDDVNKGIIDWDSVSEEIRSKRSLPEHLTTADNCRRKYDELRKRCAQHSASAARSPNGPTPLNVWLHLTCAIHVQEKMETTRSIESQVQALRSKKKRKNDDEDDVVLLYGIEYVLMEQHRRVRFGKKTEALKKEYNDLRLFLACQREIVDALETSADAANNAASPQGSHQKDEGVEVAVEQMENLHLKQNGNA